MPIPVQPVPLEIDVGTATNGSEKMIILQISTMTGGQAFFLSEVVAKQVADMLIAKCGSGIVVVPSGALPRGDVRTR